MAKRSETKRNRSVNYSSEEKILLLNLVSDNKALIECKKTDQVTCAEKETIWKQIEDKFNMRAPNNVHRNRESLRKFYENLKKKVRKEAAEDRMQTILTGGGIKTTKTSSDPVFDLTLSIMNKKSVQGLQNTCDSDSCIAIPTTDFSIQSEPVEIETMDINKTYAVYNIDDEQPVNELITEETNNSQVDWNQFKPSHLQTPLSRPLNDMKTNEKKWTQRRRPTAPTSLSSSHLSKQYSDLAAVKIEVAELQKQSLQGEINKKRELEEKEAALRIKSLECDIEIKKIRLERETSEFNLQKEILLLDMKIKEQQLKKLESLFV